MDEKNKCRAAKSFVRRLVFIDYCTYIVLLSSSTFSIPNYSIFTFLICYFFILISFLREYFVFYIVQFRSFLNISNFSDAVNSPGLLFVIYKFVILPLWYQPIRHFGYGTTGTYQKKDILFRYLFSVCLPVYEPVCLSVCLSVFLFACMSVCRCVGLDFCLSVCYLSVCPSVPCTICGMNNRTKICVMRFFCLRLLFAYFFYVPKYIRILRRSISYHSIVAHSSRCH